MKPFILSWAAILLFAIGVFSQPVIVDMAVNETYQFKLPDGSVKSIQLKAVIEATDPIRQAVREAWVKVSVDGEQAMVPTALYTMPQIVNGVKLDCALTKGFVGNSSHGNVWGFPEGKDARLRFWAPDAPLMQPGRLGYPVKQRWFASDTQMGNEPAYVDAADSPQYKNVYYHYGFDFGGYDMMVPVVAATNGRVISAGDAILPEVNDMPHVNQRYDVIYIRDDEGWVYRYSHLHAILPRIKPGLRVNKGDWIGILGKEGASGGWSHLHFDAQTPEGNLIYAYPFVVDACIQENPGALLAVARPHKFAVVGAPVRLDGSNSICDGGTIESYQWEFHNDETASGPVVTRVYDKPGVYSEILRIQDDKGREAVDFAVVQVFDPDMPMELAPPSINVTYWPTTQIKPGQEVFFKTRTFRCEGGSEIWDFGDGAFGKTKSKDEYATVSHHYKEPGMYIVTVRRRSANDTTAMARVRVIVE